MEVRVPHGWRVGWFDKTSLNLGVLFGEVLGTVCKLFWQFPWGHTLFFCFAKACLGLFFLVFFHAFLSIVMMHGACQKHEQHRVGKNREDSLKDDHGFKQWLNLLKNLSTKEEQSLTWHFSYLLMLFFFSPFHRFKGCFSFFSPSCEAKCVWQQQ